MKSKIFIKKFTDQVDAEQMVKLSGFYTDI